MLPQTSPSTAPQKMSEGDLEDQFNPDAGDDTLRLWHEYPLWRKVVGQNTLDGLVNLGDNADAFSCYSHVNMGTNPSTCNAKVYYNCLREDSSSDYVSNRNSPRNVRHTCVSGLGITMEPLPNKPTNLLSVPERRLTKHWASALKMPALRRWKSVRC